jgi:hypothetical protein
LIAGLLFVWFGRRQHGGDSSFNQPRRHKLGGLFFERRCDQFFDGFDQGFVAIEARWYQFGFDDFFDFHFSFGLCCRLKVGGRLRLATEVVVAPMAIEAGRHLVPPFGIGSLGDQIRRGEVFDAGRGGIAQRGEQTGSDNYRNIVSLAADEHRGVFGDNPHGLLFKTEDFFDFWFHNDRNRNHFGVMVELMNRRKPGGKRPPKKLTTKASDKAKSHKLTLEFSEEHWRWLQIVAQFFRLEPGNVLKLGLHRLCERLLIEKSRLISGHARDFVKMRLGNKVREQIREEITVLDYPAEIAKLVAPIEATEADMAERIQKKYRPRSFGRLHFEGGPADVGVLELVFGESIHGGEVKKGETKGWGAPALKDAHRQIEQDFFDLVAAHKHLYRSMPRMRKQAKHRFTSEVALGSKEIRELKTTLENLVITMRTGKPKGLHALLKKDPDLFNNARKQALLSSKVPIKEKIAIVEARIEKFARYLAREKDPIMQAVAADLRSRRSSPLLDDPCELIRFLNDTPKDSILTPSDPFWAVRRVAEKGY